MTFKEEMERRGYQIRCRNEEKLAIVHKNEKAEAVIIFDHTCKKMMGYVFPRDIIFDLDDMTTIYGLFNTMKEDVTVFSELSKYEVIK